MRTTALAVAKGVFAALLLHALVAWVRPETRRVPALDEGAGRVREVLLHYDPSVTFVHRTYADFLAALPADVMVFVAVERAEHAAEFAHRFGREAVPVVVERPITTWSRDRFVARADGSVVVPPEAHGGAERRRNDAYVPIVFAGQEGRALGSAPFRFDGGDFLAASGRLIASSVWTRRNRDRTVAELLAGAERLFGQPVVYLPEAPEHHVGMAIASVGNNRLLVGDARWGARLCPDDPDADRSERTAELFDACAATLAKAGFRVDRIPVLPTRTPFVWMTYTNGIHEDGVVYLPAYGREALDAAATEVYRLLGYQVRPVDASQVYVNGGTLHCLVHVLRRDF